MASERNGCCHCRWPNKVKNSRCHFVSSENDPQSCLKLRIHSVIISSWMIFPLIIQTDARVFVNEAHITGTGSAYCLSEHGISEQEIMTDEYLIGTSQAKETGDCTATRF